MSWLVFVVPPGFFFIYISISLPEPDGLVPVSWLVCQACLDFFLYFYPFPLWPDPHVLVHVSSHCSVFFCMCVSVSVSEPHGLVRMSWFLLKAHLVILYFNFYPYPLWPVPHSPVPLPWSSRLSFVFQLLSLWPAFMTSEPPTQ